MSHALRTGVATGLFHTTLSSGRGDPAASTIVLCIRLIRTSSGFSSDWLPKKKRADLMGPPADIMHRGFNPVLT